MPLLSVRLASFRNLADTDLSLDAHRVILIGENGQGKTNLLEALYYLSFGASFRGQVDSDIPRRGSQDFALEGVVKRERAPIPERISVGWKSKIKEICREGKVLRDRKELIEINPAIVYCHEDFSFSSGEPERRRFFFDQTASLVSFGYLDLLRDYRKVLSQRNAALREGREGLLEVLDFQLAVKGSDLVRERGKIAADFADSLSELFEEVARLGYRVELAYRPSWKDYGDLDALARFLASKRREELLMKTTLSGPHRDRWVFLAEGRDFAATASTGQLRLLSLVLRSTQARLYSTRSGRQPLLLLDDVLLELDPARRLRFFQTLPSSTQAIFTFLPGEDWEGYRDGSSLVYGVSDGRFTRQVGP